MTKKAFIFHCSHKINASQKLQFGNRYYIHHHAIVLGALYVVSIHNGPF